MHIFFSVGEPSGDEHGAQLIRELRERAPGFKASGFGGPKMDQAGMEQLYPLAEHAVMGLSGILSQLFTFIKLVRQAGRFFREHRPDAVVLIDFPGFNWFIARAAKRAGVRVFYYMPPQLWAWAPWRIRKVRKYVDYVLAALPFEARWYRDRGVNVEYVGHPFFDEVARHPLDKEFCQSLVESPRQAEPQPRIVGVLPGSRDSEVSRNFPVMLRVLRKIHRRHPGARFHVACYREKHRTACQSWLKGGFADLPLTLHVQRTPEIIETAECCLMVSGSVSLELLARSTPAVVVYKGNLGLWLLIRTMVTCKFMSLPNLIVGRMLLPEFPTMFNVRQAIAGMAATLDHWLSDARALAAVRQDMQRLRDEIVRTGGVSQAAAAILDRVGYEEAVRRAA